MSKTFRVIAFAIGLLAFTCDRALASYILTVPLLGDGPEAASDFGPRPQLIGFAAESSRLSLYPSISSSYPSPYVTNLLDTISDSTFANRFDPAAIAMALHTSVLVHEGGNGTIFVAGFGPSAGAANSDGNTPADQTGGQAGSGSSSNAGPDARSGPENGSWSPKHDEDGDYQGEDDDEDGLLAEVAVLPEPGSMILLGTGLLGLGAIVRRTKSARR